MNSQLEKIIKKYNSDKNRLMDILIDVQAEFGYISKEATKDVAKELDVAVVDVEQTLTFYHFFTQENVGENTIYLNDSVVACMSGREEVKQAFEQAAGCKFGQMTGDGKIGLYNTACIGMNDQEPAAIINNEVFTKLTPEAAKQIVEGLKSGKDVKELYHRELGDGKNAAAEIKSMVSNNIKRTGKVLLNEFTPGIALKENLGKFTPAQVIDEVKKSNIRGRGGAGFPTGLKWDFCAKSEGEKRYVLCNADEGEPGTFKDRVLLTERPEMLFDGMAIGAYAIGAKEGILYLRYEYKYMEEYLEKVLEEARNSGRLGKNIGGIEGFDFDIRIQFGAGAYVCGEETALIESGEGKRGEPRDKPPFPVAKGYMNMPTIINNVETFCAVVKIIENGGDWYNQIGTEESSGTKLLSISGDCAEPGVYEIDWGMTINEMLEMVGAKDVQAVQVSGPSGQLIGSKDFERKICYCDLATGGSMIVVGKDRDILKEVVLNFMEFFIEESCGSCTTCRIVPKLMKEKLEKILDGKGVMQDIADLEDWGRIPLVSRCGLGQTAMNPITTTIKNFRHLYEERIRKDVEFDQGFNMDDAVKASCAFVDRVPNAH
jgi:[NiFe] hydrogenase diaphorase moiety large subunit